MKVHPYCVPGLDTEEFPMNVHPYCVLGHGSVRWMNPRTPPSWGSDPTQPQLWGILQAAV